MSTKATLTMRKTTIPRITKTENKTQAMTNSVTDPP